MCAPASTDHPLRCRLRQRLSTGTASLHARGCCYRLCTFSNGHNLGAVRAIEPFARNLLKYSKSRKTRTAVLCTLLHEKLEANELFMHRYCTASVNGDGHGHRILIDSPCGTGTAEVSSPYVAVFWPCCDPQAKHAKQPPLPPHPRQPPLPPHPRQPPLPPHPRHPPLPLHD